MKKINCLACLLTLCHFTYSQALEETWPTTYWCPNDTFSIKYTGYPDADYYQVSRKNKSSPGTDAAPGRYVIIYYGNDSVRLTYHNKLPYPQITYINFESPKGKTTLRFHYNEVTGYFPEYYIEKNKSNVRFDIPESYELANIIWTISPAARAAKDLNTEGDYYNRMLAYFKPYRNHPIFKNLENFPDSIYYTRYYEFRENSFAFNFKDTAAGSANTELLFNGPYYYVYGENLSDSSLFGKLKPLVEDFAKKSGFRKFYQANRAYYAKQIRRERELLPVKQMWIWMETQFPQSHYDSYRIVFSPLIGGTHSTQRFSTPDKAGWFSESVMFICNADRYDKRMALSEKQKEGLMSGIVFTEIDHNYVNPVSDRYARTIDSLFSKRSTWAKEGNNSDFYHNGVSVFNEYMTHAVYCLYIADSYDKATADFVINERESMMVNNRNFIRFKEFDKALFSIRDLHKDLKAAELYPFIIDWCKQQN